MLNTIGKELKELFANKKIWIGLLTVLIIIIIGTSYNRKNSEVVSSEVLRMGVINNDNSAYSELLLKYFNSSETFSNFVNVTTGDSDRIKQAFQKGLLDIYLEIPKNFSENMVRIKHTPITVTINIKDTTKAILFQNILKSYEKYISSVEENAVGLYDIMEQDGMPQKLLDDTNRTISIDMILTALGKESFFSLQPVDKFPATTILQYYIISILIMTMLYCGLYVGFMMLKENSLGTLSRLRTTQSNIVWLLLAKMLIICLILTLLSIVTIRLTFGSILSVTGLFFCFTVSFFSVTLAAFLSSFFRSAKRYMLAGNLIIFYFTVIGGGIIPIQFLPQDILRLSKLTPNYYLMKGILLLNQGQSQQIERIILGFLLTAVLMLLISIFLFHQRRVVFDEA